MNFFSEFIYININCWGKWGMRKWGKCYSRVEGSWSLFLCKSNGRVDKLNFQPISIFYDVPKIYERWLCIHLCHCFDNFFSKHHCGFRKGFPSQHVLLVMKEKMKTARGNKEFCAAILTGLSKAFDRICQDLPIAKLNAYGFALKLFYDYRSDIPKY